MTNSTQILSVSCLTALLKELVEDNFVHVLVEGEISNFSCPSSGHFYFSLKDERAQIRTVMFRPQNRLLPFMPENGMQVICTGRVSLYPQRGEIQLVAESLEPKGRGSLQLAFEQLKKRLEAEGLFDKGYKKPLPPFPKTVGVVTSATGAAIHDILNVLKRRHAGVRVLLCPVRVQGEEAAAEIASGIADFNRHGKADVLIIGRGGGSMEDLWSFNEEIVARAIHASAIPVISAVGHETDFTIADFVADLRAPTPSAAAEMVVKSRLELEGHIDHLIQRLENQLAGRLQFLKERVTGLAARLRSPQKDVALWQSRLAETEHNLHKAMSHSIEKAQSQLNTLAGRLDTLSPLRTLGRGYALVLAEKTGMTVHDASTLSPGDKLQIRFNRGKAQATVNKINP